MTSPAALSVEHEQQLTTWLTEVLPRKTERWVFDWRKASGFEVVDGLVKATFFVGAVDQAGELLEVLPRVLGVLFTCDFVDEARARAFLRGSVNGLAARPWLEPDQVEWPTHLLDDLGLETVEDFALATESASWLNSPPDWLEEAPSLLELPTPIAVDPVVEAELEANPTRERFLVYADWLEARGDPRGELMKLHDRDDRPSRRQADLLLKRHRRYFIGNFREDGQAISGGFVQPETDFEWRWGFMRVAHLRYRINNEFIDHPTFVPDDRRERAGLVLALQALFSLPSARFLERLKVELEFDGDLAGFEWASVLTESKGSTSLRHLELWSPDLAVDEAGFEPVLEVFPRLEKLAITDLTGSRTANIEPVPPA